MRGTFGGRGRVRGGGGNGGEAAVEAACSCDFGRCPCETLYIHHRWAFIEALRFACESVKYFSFSNSCTTYAGYTRAISALGNMRIWRKKFNAQH